MADKTVKEVVEDFLKKLPNIRSNPTLIFKEWQEIIDKAHQQKNR